VPITAALAASFRACLDSVAREKRLLPRFEQMTELPALLPWTERPALMQ
jgi:hypothetical protein